MFSVYKFSQPSGACVVETTHLLETAKACVKIRLEIVFYKLDFCASPGYRTSPYFCWLDSVAQFFKKISVTLMPETTESRSSIPVGTCFLAHENFRLL